MDTNEIESVLRKVSSKHVDTDGTYVFLFGSRAGDTAKPASDYDIGLFSSRPISFGTIAKIEDELEEFPIPVFIDFVDFSMVSPEFKRIALQRIKIWNKPKNNLKLA